MVDTPTKGRKGRQNRHNALTGKYTKQANRTEANKRRRILRSNGPAALRARIDSQYAAKYS